MSIQSHEANVSISGVWKGTPTPPHSGWAQPRDGGSGRWPHISRPQVPLLPFPFITNWRKTHLQTSNPEGRERVNSRPEADCKGQYCLRTGKDYSVYWNKLHYSFFFLNQCCIKYLISIRGFYPTFDPNKRQLLYLQWAFKALKLGKYLPSIMSTPLPITPQYDLPCSI